MRLIAFVPFLLVAVAACDDDDPIPTPEQGGNGGAAGNGGSAGGAGGAGGIGGLRGAGCDPDDGQCIFRHDTFGDEQLWTDALRLHELVQNLSPEEALALGLRVDSTRLTRKMLANADLTSPATTVALLRANAVVGVHATVNDGKVESIGVTCALCHSDVDHSVAQGIGERRDGWPNRDLDVGRIIASTPGLAEYVTGLGLNPDDVIAAYQSWGPGRYDARFNQDGINGPVMLPPAYGLADVELETYTGEGPIAYWNAYVAVTQMGAQGTFIDPELGISITHTPDLLTSKLGVLGDYQRSLRAPKPPRSSFDPVLAAEGRAVFEARCASCHAGESYTDAPNLHTPASVGQDPREAERSKTGMYRATPLKGLWHRAPYFHDGSAANLGEVIAHYEDVLGFELTPQQRTNLQHFLLSL